MAEKKAKLQSGKSRQSGKIQRSRQGKKLDGLFAFPFGRRNLVVFIAALLLILVGYILLAQGPWDNPASLTVAPILLVIGYMVLIPLAIIIRDPKVEQRTGEK